MGLEAVNYLKLAAIKKCRGQLSHFKFLKKSLLKDLLSLARMQHFVLEFAEYVVFRPLDLL